MRAQYIAFSIFAASATTAFAQDAPLDDGVYVRIGAGATFQNDLNLDIIRPPSLFTCAAIGCAPNEQTTSFDTGFVGGAAIGFDYADGIRTELEYRYATVGIDEVRLFESGFEVGDELGGLPAPANDDFNAHLVMANFYFDFNRDGRISPFIGGGVGGAFVENQNTQRDAALAYQGRAGLSFKLSDGFLIDAEYIYTRSQDLDFGATEDDLLDPENISPRIDGDNYVSSTAMISLRKHF